MERVGHRTISTQRYSTVLRCRSTKQECRSTNQNRSVVALIRSTEVLIRSVVALFRTCCVISYLVLGIPTNIRVLRAYHFILFLYTPLHIRYTYIAISWSYLSLFLSRIPIEFNRTISTLGTTIKFLDVDTECHYNEFSIESKNNQNGVRTKKLCVSEVGGLTLCRGYAIAWNPTL